MLMLGSSGGASRRQSFIVIAQERFQILSCKKMWNLLLSNIGHWLYAHQ